MSNWNNNPKRSYRTKQEIALGEQTEIEFLTHLRRVVGPRYAKKFGHPLTWERSWAWEALSFIDSELNRPKRKEKP